MIIHTGVKDFACTECTQRFAHKQNLNTHLASVHDLGDCVCTLCDGNCSRLRPWVDPATNTVVWDLEIREEDTALNPGGWASPRGHRIYATWP